MAVGWPVRTGGGPHGHGRHYRRPTRDRALGTEGGCVSRTAVVGAGTMGNGIAHVFAQHGWDVALIDSAPAALDRATTTIKGNL
ncbi:MAG: 3-hydroxyacyl-CoA dehydrogenase NAD-binding domain-containing protein, partial [Gemmatimonadales bacterium]